MSTPRNLSGNGRHHTSAKAEQGLPWYFVCSRCTAKWFAEVAEMVCPRCGTSVHSTVQLNPPWLPQNEPSRCNREETQSRPGREPDDPLTGTGSSTQ